MLFTFVLNGTIRQAAHYHWRLSKFEICAHTHKIHNVSLAQIMPLIIYQWYLRILSVSEKKELHVLTKIKYIREAFIKKT